MTGGSHIHPDKYLGVAWADRPPTSSGPSAMQVLQSVTFRLPEVGPAYIWQLSRT